MKDIFGKKIDIIGLCLAVVDGLEILPGGGVSLHLIQNATLQYNRQVNRLHSLHDSNTYVGFGRTVGTLSMTKMIGLAPNMGSWSSILPDGFNKYRNSNPGGATIAIYAKTDGTGDIQREKVSSYILRGCYVNSVGVDSNVGGITILETVGIDFMEVLFGSVY